MNCTIVGEGFKRVIGLSCGFTEFYITFGMFISIALGCIIILFLIWLIVLLINRLLNGRRKK